MKIERIIFIIGTLIILMGLGFGYSQWGAPSEFGNETTTTAWIGGDDGIVNCTGIITGNGSGLTDVNSSYFWDDLDSPNSTQMEDSSGELNIKESWISSLWCKLTGCTITGDLEVQGNITISSFTNGSVLYVDEDGRIAEANEFFYFETNGTEGKLGVGGKSTLRNIIQAVKEEGIIVYDSIKGLIAVRNTATTDGTYAGFTMQTNDSDGDIYSGARMICNFTNHNDDSVSGDLLFDTRHLGTRSIKMILDSLGNLNVSGNITADWLNGKISSLSASDGSPDPALSVDAEGNVGIGTDSPKRTLHMHTDGAGGYMQLTNEDTGTGVNDGFQLSQFRLNTVFINREAGSMFFRTDNTNRMTITSTGNVGIGTTSPNAKLEINGTGVLLNVKNDSDSFLFVNSTSGNVGIGTESPSGALLHINNSVADEVHLRLEGVRATGGTRYVNMYVAGDGRVNFGGTFLSFNFDNNVKVKDGIRFVFGNNDDNWFKYDEAGSDDFEFWSTDIDGGGTDGIVWYNHKGTDDVIFNGNVGIGTTNPQNKLEVNGIVNATSFKLLDSNKIYFGSADDVSQTMNSTTFNILNEIGSIIFNVQGFLKTIFDSDVDIKGDLNVTGTIHNDLSHSYALSTVVGTVASGGVWYNITFNQSHFDGTGINLNDDNITFEIENTAHYTLTQGMGIQDSAPLPTSNVGMAIFVNDVEIAGSYIERDLDKKDADTWAEHLSHSELNAGDNVTFRYIADDTTVIIKQDDLYATQPFNAFSYIQEVII